MPKAREKSTGLPRSPARPHRSEPALADQLHVMQLRTARKLALLLLGPLAVIRFEGEDIAVVVARGNAESLGRIGHCPDFGTNTAAHKGQMKSVPDWDRSRASRLDLRHAAPALVRLTQRIERT